MCGGESSGAHAVRGLFFISTGCIEERVGTVLLLKHKELQGVIFILQGGNIPGGNGNLE